MAGFIYIMSNPSLVKGMLKIGKSSKDPENYRKLELETTGVPAPFTVEYYAFVDDHDSLERSIHQSLAKYRNYENREFFTIPLREAIKTVKEIAGRSVKLEEFSENAKNIMTKGGGSCGSASTKQELYLYPKDTRPKALVKKKKYQLKSKFESFIEEFIQHCNEHESGTFILSINNGDNSLYVQGRILNNLHGKYIKLASKKGEHVFQIESVGPHYADKRFSKEFKKIIAPLGWNTTKNPFDSSKGSNFWLQCKEDDLRDGTGSKLLTETLAKLAEINSPLKEDVFLLYEIFS